MTFIVPFFFYISIFWKINFLFNKTFSTMLHLFCYETFQIGVWECFNRQETIIPEAKNHQNVFFYLQMLENSSQSCFYRSKAKSQSSGNSGSSEIYFLKDGESKKCWRFLFFSKWKKYKMTWICKVKVQQMKFLVRIGKALNYLGKEKRTKSSWKNY